MATAKTKAVKKPARNKQIVEPAAAKDDGHEAPCAAPLHHETDHFVIVTDEATTQEPVRPTRKAEPKLRSLTVEEIRRLAALNIRRPE